MDRRHSLLPALCLASLVASQAAQGEQAAPLPDPTLEQGRTVFLTYCAGCHGFDGMAYFPEAPSFAMGERLVKSDYALLDTLRRGRNSMPSWSAKLAPGQLRDALAYLRFVHEQARNGTPVNNPMPAYYYVFPSYPGQRQADWAIPTSK